VIARRVVVRGRVQGVFFRDSARRAAASRGVAGWVRNCPDGTVEAWFEGEPEAVESMVAWARSGPSRADVESVDVDEVEPARLSGFYIR
jgi:acylphosphatase